jgi:ubiquinone biosynthesis protein COQ4
MSTTHDASCQLAAEISLAPPPPPLPFQWRRAWRLLRELIAEPERTEKVFDLLEAAGGRGNESSFQAFATDPAGRKLLRERPSLVDALADHTALAALPRGSLGRAYLDFARARDFAADGLVEANHTRDVVADERVDPDRRWYYDRLTTQHDLWHVLTSYGTDEAGEAALLAFTLAQVPSRGLRLLVLASLALLPWNVRLKHQRYLLRTWLRGRRARPLHLTSWEAWLALPLHEVRRRLGIEPAHRAHPRGILRGDRREGAPRWVTAGA